MATLRVLGKKEPDCIYKNHIKTFLNKDGHHNIAAASFKLEIHGDYFDDAVLKISDCEKNINLQFEIDPEYQENSIYKIDTLIDFLQRSKKILHEAIDAKNKFLKEKELKDNSDGNIDV